MGSQRINAWCVLALLTLPACASTLDGPQAKTTIDKLQALRVDVQQEEDFSVKKSRGQMSPVGLMFGLIGAGIEAAYRSASDSNLADTFAPALKTFNVKQVLEGKLQEQFVQSKRFATVSVDMNGAPSSGSSEGLLTVEMEEWGLRPCLAGQSDERMQVVVKAEGTLKSLPDKSILWSKEETHIEQDCHLLEKFRDEPGLLSSTFSRSFEGLAGKIANDILYP
jgi:hypothetical protein